MSSDKIDFIIAGVQKGGTTALFDHLRDHPQLQLPDLKEAHFFDDERGVDWARPDYEPYHRLFDFDFDAPQRRGEATPIYVYWPNSLERIARYNPAIRLILLFRDPRLRAWSHWRMEHARGFETEPFAWCIREGRARVAQDRDTPGFHRVFSYVERGFYADQLQRVRALFPSEQVLLLRSEDLKDDPAGTVVRVSRFLGVEPAGESLRPREVNVSAHSDTPAAPDAVDTAYLTELFEEDLTAFGAASGLDVGSWRM